uniref:Uncharacterized protein n=1 Tax=Paramormyrops kingsleyae TaxID=1676925 RepID=A0A3B3SW15_9TELE
MFSNLVAFALTELLLGGLKASTYSPSNYLIQKQKKAATETPVANEPEGDNVSKNEPTAPPAGLKVNNTNKCTKKVIQEICAFLILANVMLWVIPAFGAHPQFENGLGKQFYGFQAWFVLVNLGQPLVVFYRMHSVSALMELLISA